MVEYMSQDQYKTLEAWQQSFLYTESKRSGQLDQFWNVVLTKTLKTLSNNAELYEHWLGNSSKRQKFSDEFGESDDDVDNEADLERPNNGQIRDALVGLLCEPVKAFFSHPVMKACLQQIAQKNKLPFLFIIDEAAYLFQTHYMRSFTWVFDQPLVYVLKELYEETKGTNELSSMPTDRFFVLMLGTHTQTSHFAPDSLFPSERLVDNPQPLPSPFSSFNWDVNVKEFRAPV